jgi:hypothetical protein
MSRTSGAAKSSIFNQDEIITPDEQGAYDWNAFPEACFAADRTCPNGQATMYGVGAAKPYSRNYDGYDHGTHVSGIAVGNSGKTFGVAKDASLIAIQVYSPFTSRFDCYPSAPPCLLSYDSDQLAALEYIYSLRSTFPIAAVSLSLGGRHSPTRCCATRARIICLTRLR